MNMRVALLLLIVGEHLSLVFTSTWELVAGAWAKVLFELSVIQRKGTGSNPSLGGNGKIYPIS